jgi:hypothetical protein
MNVSPPTVTGPVTMLVTQVAPAIVKISGGNAPGPGIKIDACAASEKTRMADRASHKTTKGNLRGTCFNGPSESALVPLICKVGPAAWQAVRSQATFRDVFRSASSRALVRPSRVFPAALGWHPGRACSLPDVVMCDHPNPRTDEVLGGDATRLPGDEGPYQKDGLKLSDARPVVQQGAVCLA